MTFDTHCINLNENLSDSIIEKLETDSKERIRSVYSWSKICFEYEGAFRL